MKKNMPKIGLVSGIGPLAGSDIFAKILKHSARTYGAVEDCEYPDALLINHGIKGVDNAGTPSLQFKKEITLMIKQLEQNQANIIGVACNTAHIYFESIKIKSSTNLINLIDEVAKTAAAVDVEYLLLTSSASKEQNLYQAYLKKHGVAFMVTNDEQQALLDKAISLVMAHRLKEAGIVLTEILKLAKDAGFSAVIAGCTELPIAIDNATNTSGLTVVSSNEVLARSLADHYYQRY